MKINEVYKDTGVFSDLKNANSTKYTAIFSNIEPTILDYELVARFGNRTTSALVDNDHRDFVAQLIWNKFYDVWTMEKNLNKVELNNYDYTVAVTGNTSNDVTRTSDQTTNGDIYGYGSDEATPLKDSKQTTSSSETNTNTNTNTRTVTGRKGGSVIDETRQKLNLQVKYIDSIINDIISYICIPLYV